MILKQKYDNKIDIFSLGCIFYEMIIETPLSSIKWFMGEQMSKGTFDLGVVEKNIKQKISPQVDFFFSYFNILIFFLILKIFIRGLNRYFL